MAKKQGYSNDDILMLEGADRVRKRPAVIFGSNGISGCEHSVFEILSNSPLIIADGGHNTEGVDSAISSIQKYFPNQKIFTFLSKMPKL